MTINEIIEEFKYIGDFFTNRTMEQEILVDKLFFAFMVAFDNLKEEKLSYPKEFITDVRLYNNNYEPILKKFEDIEMKYLILSDFYDFCYLVNRK
jgi:hypothetical protein